jgi:ADP-heptose:LPS heptosyltransferase
MSAPQPPSKPFYRKVAILRMLRGLGDMLCVVPALRSLRAALPEAYVSLIGLPTAGEFVRRFSHYIDELIEYPGYPGLTEREPVIGDIPGFLASMQSRCFDLALQMHGNGTITNTLLTLLGARTNAGFFVAGQFCPDRSGFLPYVENQSEIVRYVALMESLGIPSTDFTLEFPLWKEDRRSFASLPQIKDLWPKEYVCIHPGAHDPSRRWPADRFALVADSLGTLGMSVVLTGGKAEREITTSVSQKMKHRAIDLSGQTTLGALGVLLSNARLLVCNDTGISHVAAALHVPSVVVFTNSDPLKWAPLDRDLHRTVTGSRLGSSNGRTVVPATGEVHQGNGCAAGCDERMPSAEEVRVAAESLLQKETWPGMRPYV